MDKCGQNVDNIRTEHGQANHKHKPNNGGQLGSSGFDPRPHGLLRLAKLSAHGLLHHQQFFFLEALHFLQERLQQHEVLQL